MVPILTLIFVVALSMFVTKMATIALTHTGMSRERARFQARSAFSGAGFTTAESELVVKHPVRRRIISILIVLGNAGVVTAVSSLILGFVNPESGLAQLLNVNLLIFGGALLFFATKWNWLDRALEKLINRLLEDYTEIQTQRLSKMMTVMDDFEVTSLSVESNKWLAGERLADLKLPDEGMLILGILRNDRTYIGVPRGRYTIEADDQLIIYGKAERLQSLAERLRGGSGDDEHRESVESHNRELAEQDEEVAEEGGDEEGKAAAEEA